MTPTKVHFDISDSAYWRAACGAKPAENGENLTVSDDQVTCRKCLSSLGYAA